MTKKGQSTLEYAVVIVVVVGALLAMQVYVKRSVQGKLRESTDSIGSQYVAGKTIGKYTTQQEADMMTKETFGIGSSGEAAQGRSHYEVVTPAITRREASGVDKETTDLGFTEETVIPATD